MVSSEDSALNPSSYREAQETLSGLAGLVEGVLEENDVFLYEDFLDIESETVVYQWQEGVKESTMILGLNGEKVYIEGRADKPGYVQEDRYPIGMVHPNKLEENIDILYGMLNSD